MVNTELFNKIADVIELFPDLYDQQIYGEEYMNDDTICDIVINNKSIPCGSAHCIAGWAAALNSDKVGPVNNDFEDIIDWGNLCVYGLNESVETGAWAGHELGLSREDASTLFFYDWKPIDGLTVSDALRKIGEGASVEDVTHADTLEKKGDWQIRAFKWDALQGLEVLS